MESCLLKVLIHVTSRKSRRLVQLYSSTQPLLLTRSDRAYRLAMKSKPCVLAGILFYYISTCCDLNKILIDRFILKYLFMIYLKGCQVLIETLFCTSFIYDRIQTDVTRTHICIFRVFGYLSLQRYLLIL